jgi:hypothetical protein
VLILGLASSPSAGASSIHHPIHASSLPRDVSRWLNFLAGGEPLWSEVHAPPIDATIRHFMAQELKSPDPTSTPMVMYLEWRRNLDPTRFDHYHPQMGPELQTLLPPTTPTATATTTPPTAPSPQVVGPVPDPAPSPSADSGGTPAPPAIPEPSTLTLGLALLGAGLWWRRRDARALPARRP